MKGPIAAATVFRIIIIVANGWDFLNVLSVFIMNPYHQTELLQFLIVVCVRALIN